MSNVHVNVSILGISCVRRTRRERRPVQMHPLRVEPVPLQSSTSRTLLKVTCGHMHSPGFLQEFARFQVDKAFFKLKLLLT